MKPLPLWLKIAIGLAIAFGVVLRFSNLNGKIFWLDEVSTAWAISGYTEGEVAHALASRPLLHPADIVAYQQGSGARSWRATVESLATGDAAHPPLYYLLDRSWRDFFGKSVSATRSLSAVLGLMTLVFAYFVCVELFSSRVSGWCATALMAVSPFQFYYAQEAREYVLLGALTLMASFIFLRALRLRTGILWLCYALSVTAGLYTSFLFVGVVAVHALYAIALYGSRDAGALRTTTFSIALPVAAFTPWAWILAAHRQIVAAHLTWFTTPVSPAVYVADAIAQLGGLFVWTPWSLRYFVFVAIAVAALVAFSLLLVWQRAPRNARIFVGLIILVPILPLIAADVFFGGSRLLQGRYVETAFLGAELSAAFMFATRLGDISANVRSARPWQAGFALLLLCGAASCWQESRLPAAWDANRNAYVTRFAPMINRSSSPLLITDIYRRNVIDVSVLSRSLDPRVTIAVLAHPHVPSMAGHHQLFVLNPSPRLIEQLQKRFVLTAVGVDFPIYVLDAKMARRSY